MSNKFGGKMGFERIVRQEQLANLARQITNPNRNKIITVVTTPHHATDLTYDSQTLARETEAVCDVFEVVGPENTWLLQEMLPTGSQVHSGAARTYPIGFPETQATALLRLAPQKATIEKLTRLLEGDIWAAANDASLLKQSILESKKVTATVKMLFQPNGALVQLADGHTLASLPQDLVFPGIPVDWVYKVGQKLEGVYLVNERRFIPHTAEFSAADALAHFGNGCVTLGIVRQTDRQSAQIEIFPGLVFTVAKNRITGNPLDVISRYLFLGDIVEVRIYRDDHGKVALRLDDIDEDEIAKSSLPLLPDGLPWLELNREVIESELDLDDYVPLAMPDIDEEDLTIPKSKSEPNSARKVGIPLPGPGAVRVEKSGQASLAPDQEQMYRQAISNLRGELLAQQEKYAKLAQDYRHDVMQANSSINALKNQLEQEKTRANSARDERKLNLHNKRNASDTFSRRNRFSDNETWFREEIRRVWIGRYTPDDRKRFPLKDESYRFSPSFFNFFNSNNMDEDEARKTVRAILDLVTTRNAAERIRESHEVRGSDNKPINRNGDDGLRMWIEQDVPQAKRLSYYKLRSGGFELVKVDLHDNMKFD